MAEPDSRKEAMRKASSSIEQPQMTSSSGDRCFSCFPVAVLAIILNDNEQALMLSRVNQPDQWEVVSGALEAQETVLEGVLREIKEELGKEIQVRPLGVIHAQSFSFDSSITNMISIIFVVKYLAGEVQPGGDMANCSFKWISVSDILAGEIEIVVPQRQIWPFERALEASRLWNKTVDLQVEHPSTNDQV